MENGESREKLASSKAALDVLVEIIGAIMTLNIAENQELYQIVTGELYLLTSCNCRDQSRHDDFEGAEDWSPGFFVLISRSKAKCLIVCSVSYIYLHHPMTEKKKRAELLYLEEVAISAFPVFIGHSYLLHGGYSYRGSHSLCYLTYLVSSSYDLKDVVAFTYGLSFVVVMNPTLESGKKEAEQVVGQTRGINNGDKSGKGKSEDESSAAGSTNFAQASHQKINAASIPQDHFIVRCFTPFWCK